MRHTIIARLTASAFLTLAAVATSAEASPCEARGPTQAPLEYQSVETLSDGRVRFRLCAPVAPAAKVVSGDIESIPTGYDGSPPGLAMVKDAENYWTATTARPVKPGVHVYGFEVAGLVIPDPQSSDAASQARGTRSAFYVASPQLAFERYRADIAHGLVSTVEYPSATTGTLRRAQIYTPPGYEAGGRRRYPVLYLVHGVGDTERSWVEKGRANYILDNLIADKAAPPMIVVMPFGHTPSRPGIDNRFNSDFRDDLIKDLTPYIDGHFRTQASSDRRAMAGLSMGGLHTLNFGLTRPDIFGPIGIFSIGFIGQDDLARFRDHDLPALKARAAARTWVYYTIGRSDPVLSLAPQTRALFDQAGLKYEYVETDGGHDWEVWRHDLREFAGRVFSRTEGPAANRGP